LPQIHFFETDDFKLSVWKITEPLDFFVESIAGWQPSFYEIKNAERKIQFAVSRFVTASLANLTDVSRIKNDDNRKPFIENSSLNISISHDKNFVAVMVGKKSVGIDIFCKTEKIFTIAKRFLSEEERKMLDEISENENQKLINYSLAWCAKETVFKWQKKSDIDFDTDLIIEKIKHDEILMNTTFSGNVLIHYLLEKDFCLSWQC
jgi:4'-phosphopantetheinyl transferase